jgi:hypothetical protein
MLAVGKENYASRFCLSPMNIPIDELTIRSAALSDLPRLTEIHNHYVTNTHITFDIRPFQPEERVAWFHEHPMADAIGC